MVLTRRALSCRVWPINRLHDPGHARSNRGERRRETLPLRIGLRLRRNSRVFAATRLLQKSTCRDRHGEIRGHVGFNIELIACGAIGVLL
jgi:hypothetical protein